MTKNNLWRKVKPNIASVWNQMNLNCRLQLIDRDARIHLSKINKILNANNACAFIFHNQIILPDIADSSGTLTAVT